MDLIRLEKELKKRLEFPYKWGRKQSNEWDNKTKFIYTTYSFRRLLDQTNKLDADVRNYALNRWYNFWSAMAAEYLFSSSPLIKTNKNKFDKRVDFNLLGIPFDHKTTIFPKGFSKSFEYAKNNKKELIGWLYDNQSQEGRKHHKNRLFVVLYDEKESNHWKMKSEINLLRYYISQYLDAFSKEELIELHFENEVVYSDIIWITYPK